MDESSTRSPRNTVSILSQKTARVSSVGNVRFSMGEDRLKSTLGRAASGSQNELTHSFGSRESFKDSRAEMFKAVSTASIAALNQVSEDEDDTLEVEPQQRRSAAAAVTRRLSRASFNATGSNPFAAQNRRASSIQASALPLRGSSQASSNENMEALQALLTPSTSGKVKVPRERVAELWSAVRRHFIKQSPQMMQLLLQTSLQQPYSLSIQQGFQFKYKLKTKYQIKCLVLHSKLSWQAGGVAGAPVLADTEQESSPNILNLESGHHALSSETRGHGLSDSVIERYENALPGNHASRPHLDEKDNFSTDHRVSTVHKHGHLKPDEDEYHFKRVNNIMKPSMFVCADTSRTVRMWDATRNTQLKPKSVVKLDTDVSEFVYMPKLGMYASCCDCKNISFYNQRFELLQTCHTEHYVQHHSIKYNNACNELVTIGSHEAVLWSLDNMLSRRSTTAKPIIKHKMYTNLPKNIWITGVSYDEKRHRLYAIVNTLVLVFDLHEGREIDRWMNLSERQINCIIYYETYDYSILGCANGAIKVINMTNSMVHEFKSHTRPITSLAIYPYGPIVISCALDYTVRMYNLKTFKEVYCLHLKEKPTGMQIMDDLQLYISTWDTVMVWGLNHINTSFSTINTAVSHMMLSQSKNLPARVLIRSEDGVIRIVSAVSGKVITTSLPLLETDCVREIAYCPAIDRMFLIVENGEIWVIATNINPCVVVDIWTPDQASRYDVCQLLMYGGHLNESDVTPPRYNRQQGFALLLGGTHSGQIYVYGKTGRVVFKNQIHFGSVTQMLCSNNLLFSGGHDAMIYISEVNPLSACVISPIIGVNTVVVPKAFNVLDTIICCAGEDHKTRMFGFVLKTKSASAIPPHNRSDDHVDTVTSVCPIPLLGLFVTTSRDCTIRIWDMFNSLVREIKFHDPLECLCVSSARGDLLVGIQSRIDIIKYNLYLPPGYIKSAEALPANGDATESPIQFDEKFDFLSNYMAQRRRNHKYETDLFASGAPAFDKFNKINFSGTKWIIQKTTEVKTRVVDRLPKEDEAYLPIMEKLKVIMERRQKVIDRIRKNAELERNEVERKENLLHDEFESFFKYKPYMGTLYDSEEEQKPASPIPFVIDEIEDYIPPDPLALVARPSELPPVLRPICTAEDEIRVIEASEDPIIPLMDPRSPDPVEQEVLEVDEIKISDPVVHKEEELIAEASVSVPDPPVSANILAPPPDSKSKGIKLFVAPDGELPNSVLGKTVKNWKLIHTWNNIIGVSLFKKGRVKGDEIAVNKERGNRSEMYKAKLKKMLEDQMARELEEQRKKEEELKGYIIIADEVPLADQVYHSEDEDDDIKALRKLKKFKVLKPPEIQKYPKLIDKGLTYSWFPVEEVLHPKDAEQDEHSLRKIKVEVNSEALFALAMECFKNLKTSRERKEAIEYANWILEEFGIRDTTPMVKTFMKYLQLSLFADIMNDDEIELLKRMLDLSVAFGQAQTDLLPTILMMTLHEDDGVKEQARAGLESIGGADKFLTAHALFPESNSSSRARLTSTTKPGPENRRGSELLKLASESSPLAKATQASTECRNLIMAFLRKTLKQYLILATTDFELSSKLKEVNDNGYDDRAAKKKEEEEEYIEPVKVVNRGRRRGVIFDPDSEAITGVKRRAAAAAAAAAAYGSTPMINELMPITDVEPLQRNPITTLQTPATKDFITALSLYSKYNERRMDREMKEKTQKADLEAQAIEDARLRKDKEAKLAEFMRRKEKDRTAKMNQRRMRLLELRDKMKAPSTEHDPKLTKKRGIRDHLFTGGTHHSVCHPSRERLDETLPKFPPLPNGFTTSMAHHLATMNKSMPLEKFLLSPFDDSSTQTRRGIGSRIRSAPMQTFPKSKSNSEEGPLESDIAMRYLQSQHKWQGDQLHADLYQVERELDYIRTGAADGKGLSSGRLQGGERDTSAVHMPKTPEVRAKSSGALRTGRKFFVVDLVEDVEAHKRSKTAGTRRANQSKQK
ncbi:hypothetical protein CcCBS67573_g02463 [Chytriomyces confervae]|uniref:Uncharacterized protein n=1 Tax=Chytriomyces confervae TaxID=246404 RepID=A0A507FIX3_9FUNG|nr:hypothetical protein CcCBS67573_g02463 [Chytriomyces confervae]